MVKAQLSQEKNKFTEINVKHSDRDLTKQDCLVIENALKGWRKYPDDKPNDGTNCLISYRYKQIKSITTCKFQRNKFGTYTDFIITHWMPIPEIGE